MISGRTGQAGPFPNSSFYATYHIAARNAARAMELIARWEWDAIPGSLKIENCELDLPDPGAEGILWVSNGRTFWTPDPDENDFEGRTE